MDHTPIGGNVVLVDPLTLAPLPVVMVDPRTLEVNDEHPPIFRDERYRQELEEARTAGQLRIPLTALSDGFLIDGHRRRAIALELGLKTVPVCLLSGAQARALGATYSRDERRAIERTGHGRRMLERIVQLVSTVVGPESMPAARGPGLLGSLDTPLGGRTAPTLRRKSHA